MVSREISSPPSLGQAEVAWNNGEGCQVHSSPVLLTGMLFTMSSVHVTPLLKNVSGLKDFPYL